MTDPPEREKFVTEYEYEQLFKHQILISKCLSHFGYLFTSNFVNLFLDISCVDFIDCDTLTAKPRMKDSQKWAVCL